MQQKGKKVREYSIEQMDALLDFIKGAIPNRKDATDEAISAKAGFTPGYIAQTRSRGKATPSLMTKLRLTFQQELKDASAKTYINGGRVTTLGTHEERLIRAEAHLEVLVNLVASLLAEHDPLILQDKKAEIQRVIQAVADRRFSELK